MDKNRALIEIEKIIWSKDSDSKSSENIRAEIKEVLAELQTYHYNLGKRQGLFKAINLLEEFAKKE